MKKLAVQSKNLIALNFDKQYLLLIKQKQKRFKKIKTYVLTYC